VFSVTQGDMLQRPASYRQMWGGLMSDPGYGDLSAKIKKDLKACCLYVLCRTRKRNTRSKAAYPPERGSNASTREAGPAGIVFDLRNIVQ